MYSMQDSSLGQPLGGVCRPITIVENLGVLNKDPDPEDGGRIVEDVAQYVPRH